MHTVVAPRASDASSDVKPMAPAPHTSTVEPARTPARDAARTPTASGSTSAASSNDTESGILRKKGEPLYLFFFFADIS